MNGRTRRLPTVPSQPRRTLVVHQGLVAVSSVSFARGGWLEVEETHSSGYVVNDTLDTATSPWWTTNVRLGWDGTVGSLRVRPFIGFNNVWNRFYVASVVINAANGRYYEPAPGRNVYLGFSLGAGE